MLLESWEEMKVAGARSEIYSRRSRFFHWKSCRSYWVEVAMCGRVVPWRGNMTYISSPGHWHLLMNVPVVHRTLIVAPLSRKLISSTPFRPQNIVAITLLTGSTTSHFLVHREPWYFHPMFTHFNSGVTSFAACCFSFFFFFSHSFTSSNHQW